MVVKTGFIVYDHGSLGGGSGFVITHFGNRSLKDALAYCRAQLSTNAEIRYGKYDDTEYNMKEVGRSELVGTFKRFKRNGSVKYFYTDVSGHIGKAGQKYTVSKDGSVEPYGKKTIKKKQSDDFIHEHIGIYSLEKDGRLKRRY